ACQACHITAFGKGASTEVSRNWKGAIAWNQALCMGQGGWAPEENRVANGIPDYVFFNKTSYVYKMGETLTRIDPISGLTTMADAVGGINDAQGVSFLTPIKRHTSNMAVMNSGTNAGKVIPFDVVWQFMTGYADQAAERGKAYAGYTGTHEWKTLEAELALNHGVSPATTVACANCHHGNGQFSTSYVTKLDKLGYKLKDANKDGLVNAADEAIICSQCHLQKAFKRDWQQQHAHTAKGSGIGCTFCHDIKRPERGLCEPCNADGTENTACISEFVDTNYYNHCQ
ncbi:MAG TPA: multiheme c-type cytochrome, partial [Nitrospirota bacterium]